MRKKAVQIKNVEDVKINGQWVKKYSPAPLIHCTTKLGVYWDNLTQRTRSGGSLQKRYPAYEGTENQFKDFQEFGDWATVQVGYGIEGWQLDKDILKKGNKVYCKEFCCFVPKSLNCLLEKRANHRGDCPIGVSVGWRRTYRARISSAIIDGKDRTREATFQTEEQAFAWYKVQKELYIKQVAEFYKDQIDRRVYEALLNYTVEITD